MRSWLVRERATIQNPSNLRGSKNLSLPLSLSSKVSPMLGDFAWLSLADQPWRPHSLTSHNWTQWAAWRAATQTQMWLHCCTGGWNPSLDVVRGGEISPIGAASWKNWREERFPFCFWHLDFVVREKGEEWWTYFLGWTSSIVVVADDDEFRSLLNSGDSWYWGS